MKGISDRQRDNIKFRMIEVLQTRPKIGDCELGRIFNIDRRTAKIYRQDVEVRVSKTVEKAERKIMELDKKVAESVEQKVSIWNKLKAMIFLQGKAREANQEPQT